MYGHLYSQLLFAETDVVGELVGLVGVVVNINIAFGNVLLEVVRLRSLIFIPLFGTCFWKEMKLRA